MSSPIAYRVDYRPGDPCYYSPEEFQRERDAGFVGETWGLFEQPQPGCPECVEVWRGRRWIRPSDIREPIGMLDSKPLYRGPLIQQFRMDEEVAMLFPSIVEGRLRNERPDLF